MWFPSCHREIWFSTAGRLKLWDICRAYRCVERFFLYDREGNCVSYRISHPTLGFCHQRGMPARLMMLCLMLTVTVRAGTPPGAWTGPYSPCDGHAEILKQGPMNLGVRFSTSNPTLKTEFAHAMSFWASVLDMNWHEEDSRACAIQAVDGVPDLFVPGAVARAQFPGQPEYQGWIAFNPGRSLPANELFLTAVHELGHVLGLPHSANASSAMYFLALDGPVFLDSADLAALATRHRLRAVAGKDGVPPLSLQDWRSMSR
jgi:Matrixin